MQDYLEDIRLSPTERLVLDQIYSRIISIQKVELLPPEYQKLFAQFWGQLPDGDN
jgi:hypothetical protein